MDGDERNDDELGRQAAGGDEEAFAELHGRYFPRVYDLALRLTRDRDQAALVTQTSFLRTLQALRAAQPQLPFSVQVFAFAHSDIAERGRQGAVLEGEELFASADAERLATPEMAGELPELARLAWQAARELKDEEYELLDLQVRQGLDVSEVAAVVGARPESTSSKLGQIRGSFEQSVDALVLLQRGRRVCLDLDFQIQDDDWSSTVRRRILRHHESCEVCQDTRQRHPAALELLATLTPVPAPDGWEATILERLQAVVRGGAEPPLPAAETAASVPEETPAEPGDAGGGLDDVFRRVFGPEGRGPLLAFGGGALMVIVIALASFCVAGAFDGDGALPEPTATVTVTVTATATVTPTATLTPTPTQTALPPTATQPPPPPPPTNTPVPTSPPIPTNTPVPPAPTATTPP